jgi:alanyl-tRNA synthetase
VRRVEAVTGRGAVEEIQKERSLLRGLSGRLRCSPDEAPDRLEKMFERTKELEREVERQKQKAAAGGSEDVMDRVEEVGGVKLLAARVPADDPKALREMGDRLKDRIGSGVVALGAESKGKAQLLVIVTDDLTDRFHAGNMVKAMAGEVGGGGGGRPDMAQAGGPDPSRLDQALAKARDLIA